MSMYGSGLTFGQVCNMEKERIKHALEGERCVGEDEDGFIWESCSDEEANSEIFAIFDECVHQALEAMHSGRALEHIAKQHGYDGNLKEYENALQTTDMPVEYIYEGEQGDATESEIME